MVRQQLRMEDGNQVGQHHFRFYRHTLVKRFLTHVAVDDLLLLERLKIGIADVFGLQGLVRELSFVAVDDSPVVRIRRLTVDRFKVERHPARVCIFLQEIVGPRILEQLGQETLSPDCIPVAASQFAAEHAGRFFTCAVSCTNSW